MFDVFIYFLLFFRKKDRFSFGYDGSENNITAKLGKERRESGVGKGDRQTNTGDNFRQQYQQQLLQQQYGSNSINNTVGVAMSIVHEQW